MTSAGKQTGQAASMVQSVMPLITAYMPSRVVHIAAHLGLTDLLAEDPANSETLALQTKTHPQALRRLLRALASIGVVEQLDAHQFGLTALGMQLRSNVPGSMRNMAMLFGSEREWRSWGELLHSTRTGESGEKHVYGDGIFEYLAANPEQARIFNEAMAEITRNASAVLIANYDFSRYPKIVDVGGGNGALLAGVLRATPDIRGAVFDLPSGVAEAARTLAAAGVADRCDVIAGDFFSNKVPEGADAYILKNVIHDWDDYASAAILKNCRSAMHESSKLLLMERVMPEIMKATPQHQRMAMADMNMLVFPGGQERTELDYRALCAGAGLALRKTIAIENLDLSVIEVDPS